jgi:hypothetical protein
MCIVPIYPNRVLSLSIIREHKLHTACTYVVLTVELRTGARQFYSSRYMTSSVCRLTRMKPRRLPPVTWSYVRARKLQERIHTPFRQRALIQSLVKEEFSALDIHARHAEDTATPARALAVPDDW